jgi:heme exporter protein A
MGATTVTPRCTPRSTVWAWGRTATRWCARCRKASVALETQASLWILDEPYDALDSDGIEAVNALLHAHLARGGSVLLTSHQAAGASAPPMAAFDLDAFA